MVKGDVGVLDSGWAAGLPREYPPPLETAVPWLGRWLWEPCGGVIPGRRRLAGIGSRWRARAAERGRPGGEVVGRENW